MEDFFKSAWKQHNIPGGDMDADIMLLCDMIWPFIQILQAQAVFDAEQNLNIIKTKSGVLIYDYGIAVSSFVSVVGRNNVVSQIILAEEIAKLIAQKGWLAIEIVAGTPFLKTLLWLESRRVKFELFGYQPTEKDMKIYNRLLELSAKMNFAFDHVFNFSNEGTATAK